MRVLVVEDNKNSGELVSLVLTREGYDVVTKVCGVDGIAAAREGGFDLILLDYNLPDMDGVEVCRRVREFQQRTPIMAVTAQTSPSVRNRAAVAGFDAFLIKPWDRAVFLSTVRQLLGARTAMSGESGKE